MRLTLLTIMLVASALCVGFCMVDSSYWGFAALPIMVVTGYYWARRQKLHCDE